MLEGDSFPKAPEIDGQCLQRGAALRPESVIVLGQFQQLFQRPQLGGVLLEAVQETPDVLQAQRGDPGRASMRRIRQKPRHPYGFDTQRLDVDSFDGRGPGTPALLEQRPPLFTHEEPPP